MEKYTALPNEDEEDHATYYAPQHQDSQPRWRRRLTVTVLGGVFIASLMGNLMSLFQHSDLEAGLHEGTQWAGLVRNVSVPIYSSTEYGPAVGTQEERDALWGALDISAGTIALSDHFAEQRGLPRSQRFPWDKTKGTYILGAFHQMHCLIKIQRFTSAAYRGQLDNEGDHLYPHVEHCLDSLLQDVYCHADDTPWYELPPKPFRDDYDRFQTRQCKNWDQLLDWAAEFHSCYKDENVTDVNGVEVKSEYEHYTFCPEGSEYIPEIEKYYAEHEMHRTGFHTE